MKFHKIRGVEKSVCTVEQMLAYNMAFRCHIGYGDEFKKLESAIAKSEAVEKLTRMHLRYLKRSTGSIRYNEDAVFHLLMAHLQEYLEKHFIANSYEQVGNFFTSLYPIE